MAELYRFVMGSIGMSRFGTTSWQVAMASMLADSRLVPSLLNSPLVYLAVLIWLTPVPTRAFVVERAVTGAGQLYMDITRAASRMYLDATSRGRVIVPSAAGTVVAPKAAGTVVAPTAAGTVVAPTAAGTVVTPTVAIVVAPTASAAAAAAAAADLSPARKSKRARAPDTPTGRQQPPRPASTSMSMSMSMSKRAKRTT
jgi:hypothetical protein